MQILKKAPRDPNGRVYGEPPPRLLRNVVKHLTAAEQARFQGLAAQQVALKGQMRDLLISWGLAPARQSLTFTDEGTVVDIGSPKAIY